MQKRVNQPCDASSSRRQVSRCTPHPAPGTRSRQRRHWIQRGHWRRRRKCRSQGFKGDAYADVDIKELDVDDSL